MLDPQRGEGRRSAVPPSAPYTGRAYRLAWWFMAAVWLASGFGLYIALEVWG